MIKIEGLSKTFAGKNVLNDVNVSFHKGKINMIIGQSGSGKTVLLKSIVGLYKVDKGNIYYGEHKFNSLSFQEKKEVRKEIGMLFQGGALFDSLSVEENVRFPIDMFTSWSLKEKEDRVNFCLQRVNLTQSNKQFPAELSGGMQKRVAIARAIALNPKYLFCDEPNSGLDPQTSKVIDELIKEITEEFNTTTIINTHDINSVLEFGDHITFIYKGKSWWQGNKNEILHCDNKELNDFVFASELYKKLKIHRNA